MAAGRSVLEKGKSAAESVGNKLMPAELKVDSALNGAHEEHMPMGEMHLLEKGHEMLEEAKKHGKSVWEDVKEHLQQ